MLDGMSGHRHRDRVQSAGRACRHGAASGRPPSSKTGQIAGSGRPAWLLLVAVFVLVLGTDQATKWLTWRHFDGTVINNGGYILLGSARSWFAEPVPGAVANLLGIVLIAVGLAGLLRRPRRTAVTVGGGLVAAGWTSNLLDRVGLHEWSAPGSGRGVVDFIPSGGSSRCNIADLWIVVGLILLGVEILRRRRERRSPA
jgi:lipoprotein signal peptidase